MLEIKDLEVYYGVIQAIKGISFDVNEGEVIALIGANGAGKTTALQTITGMLSAKKGSILFEGTDITDKSVDINKMRQKIGMVFQQFNLFPNYTVKGNIMLAPVQTGLMNKEEASKRADELLMRVGLSDKADTYPAMLSGGQKQRIAIARALAKNPKVLLCDEPTGALDYNTGKAVLKLLQNTCRKQGKTVIVITHNQALTAMADRVITVKSGTIQKIEKNEHIVDVDEIEW